MIILTILIPEFIVKKRPQNIFIIFLKQEQQNILDYKDSFISQVNAFINKILSKCMKSFINPCREIVSLHLARSSVLGSGDQFQVSLYIMHWSCTL